MRIYHILDTGLARPVNTGCSEGHDTVAGLQRAIKQLVKSREVMACDVTEIEVYQTGIGRKDYEEATPLLPEDPLPKTSKTNPVFVHVPHERQNLKADERIITTTPKASYEGGQHLTDEEKIAMPKFMCYYQLGDTTPYYIETQGWEATVGRLKERILETRAQRGSAPDLYGVTDITMFKIYPPGRNARDGKPIHPELANYDAPIPDNSSLKDPIIVPAIRNTEADDAAKADIAALVAARMAKKKKAKKAAAPKKEAKPITIQVQTPDGTLIPVQVKPKDTVVMIKERIADQVGVDVPNQVLQFNDNELLNEKTAKEIGVKDGSVIDLLPNTITVHVQTPDKRHTVPVEIDPITTTIGALKEAVAPDIEIEAHKQVMLFMGEELPNDNTAEELGLQDGDVIKMEETPITITVRTPEGEEIPVSILPSATIKIIKDVIAPDCGVAVPDQVLTFEDQVLPNNETAHAMGLRDGDMIDLAPTAPKAITVQVRTEDGLIIPVEVQPSDTIQSIKEAVAAEAGIEVPEQVMKYNENELPNEETAENMGLQDGSVIDLAAQKIVVRVRTPDGKLIPVTVDPCDPVQSIKQAVAAESGIEVPKQMLAFKNARLPDEDMIVDAGIWDGDIIDLGERPITVQVRTPDGEILHVIMNPSDSILSIKESVAPVSGIDVPDQILSFDGEELPDNQTAENMGLADGSVIDLAPNTITVQVRTPDGKLIPVTLGPSDSIGSIKESVAPESGIDVADQLMVFNENELMDDDTAEAAGLKNGSIIDLEPSVITVQVRTPDGKLIPVIIDPFEKIGSLKAAVEPEAGIEAANQVLVFNGEELPDDSTGDAAGLKNGSVIDLEPSVITVEVRTPEGEEIPVTIDPYEKVEAIKLAVEEQTGIVVPDQILIFDDKELVDEVTADASGLMHGSVINLKPAESRDITIDVKCPDGKTISLTIQPANTIQSIKEAVGPAAEIDVLDQVLKFQDKELSDEDTAEAAGLEHGSVLDLSKKVDDAEAKYLEKKAKKEKKEKKKKKKSKDSDWDPSDPNAYHHEFNPTPMDLTRHKAYFMVGGNVPMQMICPAPMTVLGFKEEVIKLKDATQFVKRYLAGITDPDEIDVYPAGSWGEGTPLPDHILVPRDSSEYAMFEVKK